MGTTGGSSARASRHRRRHWQTSCQWHPPLVLWQTLANFEVGWFCSSTILSFSGVVGRSAPPLAAPTVPYHLFSVSSKSGGDEKSSREVPVIGEAERYLLAALNRTGDQHEPGSLGIKHARAEVTGIEDLTAHAAVESLVDGPDPRLHGGRHGNLI